MLNMLNMYTQLYRTTFETINRILVTTFETVNRITESWQSTKNHSVIEENAG